MTNDKIGVRIRLFAGLREAAGFAEKEMAVPEGTTVAGLIERLTEQYPTLGDRVRFLHVAVNRTYVGMETPLKDGDEVACIPPVGGG